MKRLLPGLLVIMVAIISVWRVVTCITCIADYGKDGVLINWIINTGGGNLYGLHSGIEGGIFDGNILYPYTHVLAYSDMFFVTSAWVYPIGLWLHDPAVVSGLALVAGQVVTLFVIYKWWKKMSDNVWGAAIATIAFGLSQIRFEYQVHLQMWSMQWWLIGTWLICAWLAEEKKKDWKLFIGAGLIGLQVWESLLPVYFAGLIITARYMTCLPAGRNHDIRGMIKKIIIAAVLFGVIAAAPLLVYWGVGREFNYQRSIRDAANNSLAVNDIWQEFSSPGLYIVLIIAIIKIIKIKQNTNKQNSLNKNIKWLSLVLVTSLIIAFGPVLKWGSKTVKIGGKLPIPLPYSVMYYLVPGFGAMRTPSRWIWVTGWAASGLIALGLREKASGIRIKAAIAGMVFLAIISGKSIKYVRSVPNMADTPVVFKWLAKQDGETMVILPMANEEWEIDRLPYTFVHQKKTVNGFSGFYPPFQAHLGTELTEKYPDENTTKLLKDLKVNWVVIDKKRDIKYEIRDKILKSNKKWEDENYAAYRI